jgi:hypothetical protein
MEGHVSNDEWTPPIDAELVVVVDVVPVVVEVEHLAQTDVFVVVLPCSGANTRRRQEE